MTSTFVFASFVVCCLGALALVVDALSLPPPFYNGGGNGDDRPPMFNRRRNGRRGFRRNFPNFPQNPGNFGNLGNFGPPPVITGLNNPDSFARVPLVQLPDGSVVRANLSPVLLSNGTWALFQRGENVTIPLPTNNFNFSFPPPFAAFAPMHEREFHHHPRHVHHPRPPASFSSLFPPPSFPFGGGFGEGGGFPPKVISLRITGGIGTANPYASSSSESSDSSSGGWSDEHHSHSHSHSSSCEDDEDDAAREELAGPEPIPPPPPPFPPATPPKKEKDGVLPNDNDNLNPENVNAPNEGHQSPKNDDDATKNNNGNVSAPLVEVTKVSGQDDYGSPVNVTTVKAIPEPPPTSDELTQLVQEKPQSPTMN